MPRVIDAGDAPAITLDHLADTLATTPVDARDDDDFASLGPLLAGLGRNRIFLADLAIAELKDRHQRQTASSYGPQVMLLAANARFVVRANFWPAPGDAVMRASGPAAFFYGFAHDHNFPFLTCGYAGPGYLSDDYVVDDDAVERRAGETVALTPAGRTRLDPGRLLLYRAHRDVHVQHPPEALSISLNILARDPAQPWRDQFEYDIASRQIVRSMTTTASEALVALAVHFGGGNGIDLASEFAAQHPSPRMRRTAAAALASVSPLHPHAA